MSTETRTTELDLDAIEARANAATEGPWIDTTPHDKATEWGHYYDDPMVVTLDSSPGNFCAIAQDIRQGPTEGAADAAFIAAARTDVPALAAEVRRLRASVKQLIDFRNVTIAERDALADRVTAVRAIAGPDVLAALGEPHPAESRPAVVFPS